MRIEEQLRKGVPVNAEITINITHLLDIISNKEEVKRRINRNYDKYMNYIIKKANPKSSLHFFVSLSVRTNPTTLEKEIYFSPQSFFSTIATALNIKNVSIDSTQTLSDIFEIPSTITNTDDKELVEPARRFSKERLAVLRNISSEKKFKKEFPSLYETYVYDRDSALKMKQKLDKIDKLPEPQRTYNIQEFIKNFYYAAKNDGRDISIPEVLEIMESSRNFSLHQFCNDYATSIENLLDNVDDIIDYLLSHKVDIGEISKEDSEKLELYIADRYFLYADAAETSAEKQFYVYYLSSYFAEDERRKTDTTTSINIETSHNNLMNVDIRGVNITPKDLYEKYKRLLVSNKDLYAINFAPENFEGMTTDEVSEFMAEFLRELSANWELLPEGENIDKEVVTSIGNSCRGLTEEEQEARKNHLIDIYMQKKEFFDSTDPFFRIRGINTFDGYVGYIYSNGKVVLEKFYDNASTGKVASENAIYYMNIEDFYRLSRYPKQTLINQKLCNRIYHSGAWQERVQEVINQPGTFINPAKEIRQLVKENKVTGLDI